MKYQKLTTGDTRQRGDEVRSFIDPVTDNRKDKQGNRIIQSRMAQNGIDWTSNPEIRPESLGIQETFSFNSVLKRNRLPRKMIVDNAFILMHSVTPKCQNRQTHRIQR